MSGHRVNDLVKSGVEPIRHLSNPPKHGSCTITYELKEDKATVKIFNLPNLPDPVKQQIIKELSRKEQTVLL